MSRSSLRRAVLVAMILGSTALSAPPLAATEVTVATPDGAALLADSLMDGIKRWLPPTPEGGGPEWGGDGKAKAEVDGDAYRVTLPALTLRTEDESRLLVGEIVMSLKPLAGGDWQLLETRLPGEIPVVDAGRKRQATLTLAQPALTGRWSARFETFLDMDARLNGARLTGIQDKAGLSLGPVTVKTGYTPQDDERWNGTSTVSLRDARLTDEAGVEILRLGALTADATARHMDLARYATLNRLLQDLGGAEPDANQTAEMLGMFRGMIGAMTANAALTGFAFKNPEDGTAFAIKEAGFGWSAEDLDRNAATLRLGFRHDGLMIHPLPGPKELLPEGMQLSLAATGLPADDLWKTLTGFLGTVQDDEEQADEVADLLGPQVMAMLEKAGAELKIETLAITAPVTQGQATGAARFDGKAAQGVTASGQVVLTGLDAAAKALKPAKGQKPDSETQDALGIIAMIQVLGQAGKDAQGRETRTYNLELAADGRMLLNGADLSTLTEGLGK